VKCIAVTNLLQLSLSNYNSRETLACLHLLKQNADIETREGFVCFVPHSIHLCNAQRTAAMLDEVDFDAINGNGRWSRFEVVMKAERAERILS
jgi:hypothetical protein